LRGPRNYTPTLIDFPAESLAAMQWNSYPLKMRAMRPVDDRQVRSPRTSTADRVQQAVLTVCAVQFVVLLIVGAPLWGWTVALVAGLVVVSVTEYFLRRRTASHSRNQFVPN
jgi:hypothetical protein